MENVDINGFNTLEGAKALFQQVNCIGQENCFVVAYNRDYLPSGTPNTLNSSATVVGMKNGGIVGGLAGGMVANAITNAANQAVEEFQNALDDDLKVIFNREKYCGFLLNKTESGIGFIPLMNDYKLLVKVVDFKTDLENFVFISNEKIKSIEANKLALNFGKRILKITFNNENNAATAWTLPMKHKLIKYQEENFNKFITLI